MFVDHHRSIGKVLLLALATLATHGLCLTFAAAQCQRQHIHAQNPGPADGFGGPNVISGNHAAIRQVIDGKVCIQMFARDARDLWSHASIVTPPVPDPDTFFGDRLAIDGDVFVVNAVDGNANPVGKVFVFRHDEKHGTWDHDATLVSEHDGFGTDVDVSGDTIIVGAHPANAALIYDFNKNTGWQKQAELTDGGDGFEFGRRVQIDGDLAAVSATQPITNLRMNKIERIECFQRGSKDADWIAIASVERPDPSPAEGFGAALALDNDTMAVGALSSMGVVIGLRVHLFHYDRLRKQWVYEGWLNGTGQYFTCLSNRRWIALANDCVVFGESSLGCTTYTRVFIGKRNRNTGTWSKEREIEYPYGWSYAWFPSAHDGRAIISRWQNFLSGPSYPGEAYVFDLAMPDCNRNLWCDDLDIANGASRDDNRNGVPDECEGILGDVTHDGRVDFDDFITVILDWGRCPPIPASCAGDANHSGVTDVDDLIIVVLNWGATA